MKLNEIHLTAQHTKKRFKVSDFDPSTKRLFGRGEGGLFIYQQKTPKDNAAVLFTLESKDAIILSSVIGYFFTYGNITYFKVLDVFTAPQYQKKGYATALYTALVRKYKLKLMSGAKHTERGKQLWSSIQKVLNVKVLDVKTNKIFSMEEVSDEDIYIKQPDRYLLIAERTYHNKEHKRLIETSISIADKILSDYLNYTHPDNIGKYN